MFYIGSSRARPSLDTWKAQVFDVKIRGIIGQAKLVHTEGRQ